MAVQGRVGALILFIGIFIYFFAVTFLLNIAQNFSATYSLSQNFSITNASHTFSNTNQCIDEYSPTHYVTISQTNTGFDQCSRRVLWTRGEAEAGVRINLTERCNSIQGCNWTNSTSFWGNIGSFFTGISENGTCLGTIDYPYYGAVNNSNWTSEMKTDEFCNSTWIINSRSNCETFGCTWTNPNTAGDGTKGIFSTIADMLTYNINFGFSSFWNGLLTTIFIYIPFFILLGVGYILLPFIG